MWKSALPLLSRMVQKGPPDIQTGGKGFVPPSQRCIVYASVKRRWDNFVVKSANFMDKLGDDDDRFSDYLCVHCDNSPSISGCNQVINTKFTKYMPNI